MLQETVKVHWAKLYILLLLLLVWGALLPAYACPPEVDKAVAQLQKSARAKISAEDWLVQVVDKKSTFYNLKSKGPLELISGSKIVQRKSWASLFPDKRSLVNFKKYLAEVKIRQSTHESNSPRKIVFNSREYSTYYYCYPSSDPANFLNKISPESACQLEIILTHTRLVDRAVGEVLSAYHYYFDLKNGKMKLMRIGLAG